MSAWNDSEIDFLRRWYPHVGARQLTKALGRSEVAISKRAAAFGIRMNERSYKWRASIRLLGRKWPTRTSEHRWQLGAAARARSPWNRERVAIIKHLYPTYGPTRLSNLIGGTKYSVRGQAKKLGVRMTTQARRKLTREVCILVSQRPEVRDRLNKQMARFAENLRRNGKSTAQQEVWNVARQQRYAILRTNSLMRMRREFKQLETILIGACNGGTD